MVKSRVFILVFFIFGFFSFAYCVNLSAATECDPATYNYTNIPSNVCDYGINLDPNALTGDSPCSFSGAITTNPDGTINSSSSICNFNTNITYTKQQETANCLIALSNNSGVFPTIYCNNNYTNFPGVSNNFTINGQNCKVLAAGYSTNPSGGNTCYVNGNSINAATYRAEWMLNMTCDGVNKKYNWGTGAHVTFNSSLKSYDWGASGADAKYAMFGYNRTVFVSAVCAVNQVCYADNDNDTYTTGTTIMNLTCNPPYYPASHFANLSQTDCDDNNNNTWQNVSNLGIDRDNDGYTLAGSCKTRCVGSRGTVFNLSEQYCGNATCTYLGLYNFTQGCNNKSSILSEAGINLYNVASVDVIAIQCGEAGVGPIIVTCPAGTNYDVCVKTSDDGHYNKVTLGVRYTSISRYSNDSLTYPFATCSTQPDCNDNSYSLTNICGNLTGAIWTNMKGVPINNTNIGDTVRMSAFGANLNFTQNNISYVVMRNSTFLWWTWGNILSPTSSESYWVASLPGNNTFFNASTVSSGITYANISNYLNVSANLNDTKPVAIITFPTQNMFVSAGSISFTQASYDEDDFLNLYWDFGDGANTTIYNYSYINQAQGNAQHNYLNPGVYTATLTASEVSKPQSTSAKVTLYVVQPGINVFPIITNPSPPGVILGSGPVVFNASQTFVVNCSAGVIPNFAFKTSDNTLNCSYLKYPGTNVSQNLTGYSLLFNWTMTDGNDLASKSGYWADPTYYGENGAVEFLYNFQNPGMHNIELTVTYTN